MNLETYHIPANFTDAGRVLGLFEIRNVVEAALLAIPALYLCLALLPFSLTPKIITTIVIVIPIGGFALTGIRDDSLTRWLKGWLHWRRLRRISQHVYATSAIRDVIVSMLIGISADTA